MGNNPNQSEIFEILNFYRGLILDLAEQTCGNLDNWPFFRGRLLGLLGTKGIEGRLQSLFGINPQNKSQENVKRGSAFGS